MDTTQIRTIAPFALIGAALMLAVLAFATANSKPTSSQLLIQMQNQQAFS